MVLRSKRCAIVMKTRPCNNSSIQCKCEKLVHFRIIFIVTETAIQSVNKGNYFRTSCRQNIEETCKV